MALHSALNVNISIQDYAKLMVYLEEPRTRKELQDFCKYSSRDYFRTTILNPLIEAGIIDLTIPDKPSSLKQKYVKHKSE